jgi:tight adherence protein B
MTGSLLLLRGALLALVFTALGIVAHGLASDPASPPRRALSAYIARLDRDLDLLFWPRRGRRIALTQAILIIGLGVAAVGTGLWALAAATVLVALAPRFWLTRAVTRKRLDIEQRLPGVARTLANSLRATPNLVAAIEQTQRLCPPGLDRELELVLEELHVGSTLEPALLRMGARVRSNDLDAVLTAILITRQVGGHLPEVLETLAASLREMARLAGVLRTKTAEGRIQFLVVALAPPALVLLFGKLRPGHFEPLFASHTGLVICLAAALLWVSSVLMARKVLAVKL